MLNRRPVVGGFTLMELLIVIGVVAILVATGVFAYSQLLKNGRNARRRADAQMMAQALDQYYLINDQQFPDNADCTGLETYLTSGNLPIDPYQNADPTFAYDLEGACSVDRLSYCVCVKLELEGAGNAFGRSDAVCNWTVGESRDYFCIESKQ